MTLNNFFKTLLNEPYFYGRCADFEVEDIMHKLPAHTFNIE
jgi:hypothetical protein